MPKSACRSRSGGIRGDPDRYSINPGNSGGALVDQNGQLIGITAAGATLGGAETSPPTPQGSIGLGFAVPVQQAMRIASELIATGHASHGWLGAKVSSDTAARGARIDDVTAGSPAAAAGLTAGAIVTAVVDQGIASGNALIAAVQSKAPGTTVTLTFIDTAMRIACWIGIAKPRPIDPCG